MQVDDFTGSNPEGKSFLPSLHHGSFSMIAGASAHAKSLRTYLVTARIGSNTRHFCKLARSSGEALAAMIAALPDGCAFGLSARPVGGAA